VRETFEADYIALKPLVLKYKVNFPRILNKLKYQEIGNEADKIGQVCSSCGRRVYDMPHTGFVKSCTCTKVLTSLFYLLVTQRMIVIVAQLQCNSRSPGGVQIGATGTKKDLMVQLFK
jgi:hypothetical protein